MTSSTKKQSASLWFLPVTVTWRMVTAVANRVGILATLGIGAALAFVGYALIGSVIGFPLGAPLFVLGLFFLARGLY